MDPQPAPRSGYLYAILACSSWGILPLFWNLFGADATFEVVSHRILWSVVLLAILVKVEGREAEVLGLLRDKRSVGLLFVTAALLTINWGLFIYSVATHQVVQASLGYFLCPLANIFLGAIVLKERLGVARGVAVLLAMVGAAVFGWNLGQFPLIAIGLAVTFSLYGLIRKTVAATPLGGLLVETLVMAQLALVTVVVLHATGRATFGSTPLLTVLFIASGVVTTVPLIWFNKAAKLLPLGTLGILQYQTPTLQLLIGVLLFGEAFPPQHWVAFLLIWVAIALYLFSSTKTPARKSEETPFFLE